MKTVNRVPLSMEVRPGDNGEVTVDMLRRALAVAIRLMRHDKGYEPVLRRVETGLVAKLAIELASGNGTCTEGAQCSANGDTGSYLTNEAAAKFLRIRPESLGLLRRGGLGPKYRRITIRRKEIVYARDDLESWLNAGNNEKPKKSQKT